MGELVASVLGQLIVRISAGFLRAADGDLIALAWILGAIGVLGVIVIFVWLRAGRQN